MSRQRNKQWLRKQLAVKGMPPQLKCFYLSSNATADLDTTSKLEGYEDEDIFDVVVKLEKSSGLKFEKDGFYNVKTIGDLSDVFENIVSSRRLNQYISSVSDRIPVNII